VPTTPKEDAVKPSDFGIVTNKNHKDFEDGTGRQVLVKWECMNYSESSYEFKRDLILGDIEYKDALKAHYISVGIATSLRKLVKARMSTSVRAC
jgi:hypothetical protein